MALVDTLSAIVRAEIRTTLSRAQGSGGDFSGLDRYDHLVAQALQNGNGARQAIGAFTAEFSMPITQEQIQMASTDPLGLLSDEVTSSDPANLSLRAICFENLDDPVTGNFFTITPNNGAPGLNGWIQQNRDLQVNPGGVELATFPNGITPWGGPGSGDGLQIQADTAAVLTRFTYLFG